jgi:phenylacetate-CoA ligase
MEGMILDEGVIVEIVRPGTGNPVPDGEVGEVVVTTLNPDYPLIRFATGDLSARPSGAEPVRAHQHADQGLDGARRPDHQDQGHVRPARAGGRASWRAMTRSTRARVVATREGEHGRHDRAWSRPRARDAERPRRRASMQAVLKLKGGSRSWHRGSLPNDGKVIDDQRSYETA